MKKILFVALMFTALNLNAQVGKKFTFGPKAAGTITSVTNLNKAIGDDDGGSNAKAGFQIGGFVEYKPSKLIGLSAEVLYSEQGAENKITIIGGSSTTYKNTTKLNYLDIPILFKIYPVGGFSINVGVQPGFLLSAKREQETNGVKEKVDVKSVTEKIDFSIPMGVSYSFRFGLVLDARYNLGVTKINKVEENGIKLRNSVFAIGAGWRF